MKTILFVVLLFLCVVGFAVRAGAVELSNVSRSQIGCTSLVSGEIASGASLQIRDWLLEKGAYLYSDGGRLNYSGRLCFDSPGGSFREGIEIARLLHLTATGVDDGHRCESACFLAFMAGTFDRMEDRPVIPDRVMHPTGSVGYHAPGLTLDRSSFSADEVAIAWRVALLSVAELVNLRQAQPNYSFRDELLEDMLRTPIEEMRNIETVGDATLFNIVVAPVLLPGNGHGQIEGLANPHSSAFSNACRALGRMSEDFDIEHGPESQALVINDNGGLSYSAVFDPGESGTICSIEYRSPEQIARAEENDEDPVFFRSWMIGSIQANDWWIPPNDFEVAAFMHYPPQTRITDLLWTQDHHLLNAAIIQRALDTIARGIGATTSCWLTFPNARITNVTEYVNLRRQPDFSAPVVRQVPLGERVRAQRADNITVIGQERDRQSCINACQAFGRNAEDRAARERAQQCIQDNMIWNEVTDARNNRGWVSRRYLEEVQ